MPDKRRHKRLLSKGLNIHCKVHFTTAIELLNISSSGALVSLTKPLHIGQKYNMHIKHGKSNISLAGTVVWERLVGSQKNEDSEIVPQYKAGLRFDSILTNKGDELINFIETAFLPKEFKARLSGIRVKMPDSEGSISEEHKEFHVIKISPGGMLLETSPQLDLGIRCNMEMAFPGQKSSLKFVGKVASSREIPGRDPKAYEAGIEIQEISEESKAKLADLIDSLHGTDKKEEKS